MSRFNLSQQVGTLGQTEFVTLSCSELEPAEVEETIVILGHLQLVVRLLARRRPWLLTAIGERKFADVNHSGVYRNKDSNNLGAAPGNLVSVRSNGVRR